MSSFRLAPVTRALATALLLAAASAFAGGKILPNGDLQIQKDEITATAKFYQYKVDGVLIEILALRAPDGTVRTALNTCQVCYSSGRGWYKQEGDVLVCQNCGNRFKASQVEIIKPAARMATSAATAACPRARRRASACCTTCATSSRSRAARGVA